MIRVFTLFSLLFIFSLKVIASEYYWLRTFTKGWKNSYRYDFLEGRLGEDVLNALDSIYSKMPNEYLFFYNGEELQSYIGCGFDLYAINEGNLKLKYNYFNRGYTCFSTAFVRDSTNYLLGGHGFWTNHFDLFRFEETHGSWELVITINQPLEYVSKAVYLNSKGIYSLFGGKDNIRTGLEERVSNGYFLDWESKEWKEIEIRIDGVNNAELVTKGSLKFLQTKDYFFFLSTSDLQNTGWNIIEKESGKIYFYDYLKNEDVFISPFIEVIGNKVNYQSPNGTPKSLDMELLLSKSREVGAITIKEASWNLAEVFHSKESNYILIGIILMLIFLNFYLRKKPKQSPKIINGDEEIEKMIASFSQYASQLLTTEELDGVLGIDSIDNNDSKRLKRSRWINRLNLHQKSKYGRDLIVRDKNPGDKRYIYYRING